MTRGAAHSNPAPNATSGRGLVRLVALVAPRDRRAEWLAEWEGELAWRWQRGRRDGEPELLTRAALVSRSLGAVPDALWMRNRHGGHRMLTQDVRYAIRTLARRPVFSAIVVVTLALAIGANAAIFTVVNAVLLRQLPFRDPDRLVFVYGTPTDGDSTKVPRWTSYPNYLDLRAQSRVFDQVAAFHYATNMHSGSGLTLTSPGVEPQNVVGAAVSANFFATLGVSPIIGRVMDATEDARGGAPVVVLGHQLWQSRFGGDPAVVGRTITLNAISTLVIGVMPPGFEYPRDAEFWIPAGAEATAEFRSIHTYIVMGRLRGGVSVAEGNADVRTAARRLEEAYPKDNARRAARLEPMRDAVVGGVRPQLLMLAGAVGLVLLVGCTNVASLFLARATSREREAAVRTALGAGRGRLVRQLLTESVLLSLAGGAAGFLVAWWGVRALLAAVPQELPRTAEVGIDASVLLFLLVVSVVVGVAFGALPAWHFARGEALSALRGLTRAATRGVRHARTRRTLVAVEVALAVVLVVTAGLLLKSFVRLQRVEPGFDPSRLVMVPLALPQQRYPDAAKRLAFYDALRERVAALPGVERVAISLEHPLSEGWSAGFTIDGRPEPVPGEGPEGRVRPITPGYFATAGIAIVAGRDVAESDRVGAPGVVVVNKAFARKYFPGENPLGARIRRPAWWLGMPTSFEIVGVVSDERFLGLATPPDPATYFPFAQFSLAQVVMVKLRGGAGDDVSVSFASAFRQAVWSLDKDLPVERVTPMQEVLRQQLAAARFNAGLLTLFAFVALALAALGVYGVLSYTVAQRSAEIGIRMALGATRRSVLALVVGEGVVVAVTGVAGGLVASSVVTRLLSRLLYDVSATDATVFGLVALLLTVVAVAAAFVPARRASRVDPLVAMRRE